MRLKGTGRVYKPVGFVWVLAYMAYIVGLIALTVLFSVGWVFYI